MLVTVTAQGDVSHPTVRVDHCNITKCCTKVFPEGITITDNAITPLKERRVDRLY